MKAWWLLPLFIGLVSFRPLEAQEAKRRVSKSTAKRFLKAALWGKKKARAKAHERLLECRPEDRKNIFDVLEKLTPRPSLGAVRSRRLALMQEVPESEKKQVPFVVRLPKGYNPKRPSPLLFRLHGSGDNAHDYDRGNEASIYSEFLIVTPEIPTNDRMNWAAVGAGELLDGLLDRMLREFAVDRDRVYLSGYSAGGAAANIYAQWWPHRFAAIRSMGRLYHAWHPMPEASMELLRHVPGHFAVGLSDIPDRVKGYREAEAYYKKAKLEGVFHFTPGVGHSYQEQLDKPFTRFLLEHRRKRYPKTFSLLSFSYSGRGADLKLRTRQYWAGLKDPHPSGTAATVRVEGNRIEIKGDHVKHGRVLLNDHILDMDQEVEIVVNGKVVHSAAVERSVAFLMQWYEKHQDPGDMYWAEVEF